MNKDILIIGESCRDIFVYCDCTRLCPDIPVPALKVLHQKENEGMAKMSREILYLWVAIVILSQIQIGHMLLKQDMYTDQPITCSCELILTTTLTE